MRPPAAPNRPTRDRGALAWRPHPRWAPASAVHCAIPQHLFRAMAPAPAFGASVERAGLHPGTCGQACSGPAHTWGLAAPGCCDPCCPATTRNLRQGMHFILVIYGHHSRSPHARPPAPSQPATPASWQRRDSPTNMQPYKQVAATVHCRGEAARTVGGCVTALSQGSGMYSLQRHQHVVMPCHCIGFDFGRGACPCARPSARLCAAATPDGPLAFPAAPHVRGAG